MIADGGVAPLPFRAAEPALGELGRMRPGPRAGTRRLEEIDVAHDVKIIRVVHDDEAIPKADLAGYRVIWPDNRLL